MAEFGEPVNRGLGWLPDLPDHRDYTLHEDQIRASGKQRDVKQSIKSMATTMKLLEPAEVTLPAVLDLRSWCSPIEDQGDLGSCTAHAGVGLVEYFERRAFGKHLDASRLFLYKTTRNLMGLAGDTGAYLRTTMAAMVLFGLPPEKYWPYTTKEEPEVKPGSVHWDREPAAFHYSFAQNYKTISYYRLDPPSVPSPTQLLTTIKTLLYAGLPSMFGFAVFSSIGQASNDGKIPWPTTNETLLGGHAVVAIGYDDNLKIKNSLTGGIETTGALVIRNSWGKNWGDHGYGYLPYQYVLSEIAVDWWSVLKSEWVDTGIFGLQ